MKSNGAARLQTILTEAVAPLIPQFDTEDARSGRTHLVVLMFDAAWMKHRRKGLELVRSIIDVLNVMPIKYEIEKGHLMSMFARGPIVAKLRQHDTAIFKFMQYVPIKPAGF